VKDGLGLHEVTLNEIEYYVRRPAHNEPSRWAIPMD
jgi:hypothetical protein